MMMYDWYINLEMYNITIRITLYLIAMKLIASSKKVPSGKIDDLP